MSRLSDIPPELLLWIISHVEDLKDLLNLSLVSKTFNKCTEYKLYESYIHAGRGTESSHHKSMERLLRTVLSRPELGRHVKKIDLGPWPVKHSYKERAFGYKPKRPTDEDFNAWIDAAKRAHVIDPSQDYTNLRKMRRLPHYELWAYGWDSSEEESEWNSNLDPDQKNDIEFARCLRQGIEEAKLVLLLGHLPRIEEMFLRGVTSCSISWDRLFSQSHGFHSLTRLTASGCDGYLEFLLADLAPIIRLPSMRVLEAYVASDYGQDRGVERLQFTPKSLHLTSIFLEFCAFSAESITNLLQGCKGLEKFIWKTGDPSVGSSHFTAPELREALLSQKRTLKHLHIDLSTQWDYFYMHDVFGSLAGFKALEVLTIDDLTLRIPPPPSLNLLGSSDTPLEELFPLSIGELNIISAGIDIPELLLDYAIQLGPTKRLNRINADVTDLRDLDDDLSPPTYEALARQFHEMGVKYTEIAEESRDQPSLMSQWTRKKRSTWEIPVLYWNAGKRRYTRSLRKPSETYHQLLARIANRREDGQNAIPFVDDQDFDGSDTSDSSWKGDSEHSTDGSEESDFGNASEGLTWDIDSELLEPEQFLEESSEDSEEESLGGSPQLGTEEDEE